MQFEIVFGRNSIWYRTIPPLSTKPRGFSGVPDRDPPNFFFALRWKKLSKPQFTLENHKNSLRASREKGTKTICLPL